MIKLKNELAALALSDLEEVVGGGKIGDAAQKASEGSGLFKAASQIGAVAVLLGTPWGGGGIFG